MATQADFKRIGNYAVMYNHDRNIDRHQLTRTVPLEVICLGYSRTGTLSMHKALTVLGYPSPYHFSSIYENPREADMWMEAINFKYHGTGNTRPDKAFFDAMLGHCGAVSDIPCILFWHELLTFYPDAKVVLVQRDEDSWYASWMKFCESAYATPLYLLARLDPSFLRRVTTIGYASVHIAAGFAETRDQARVRSRDAYRHYYADVRAAVPVERLLDFQLRDGWAPLCDFLGKPVPDEPFPHENDGARNKKAFEEMAAVALKRIAKHITLGVATLVFGFGLWYWSDALATLFHLAR